MVASYCQNNDSYASIEGKEKILRLQVQRGTARIPGRCPNGKQHLIEDGVALATFSWST